MDFLDTQGKMEEMEKMDRQVHLDCLEALVLLVTQDLKVHLVLKGFLDGLVKKD